MIPDPNAKSSLRPIETAPRDGSQILAVEYDHFGEDLWGATFWNSHFDMWQFNTTQQIAEDTGMCSYEWNPSHWMPLPQKVVAE